MRQAFSVPPPPSHAGWILGALLAIPLVIVAVTLATVPTSSEDAGSVTASLTFAVVTVIAVAILTFWGLARRQVVLDGHLLQVKAAMFGHKVDATTLDLERARVVDLDERTELKPALKTWGMSLPGFHAGWFMLRDKSRGFCLVTVPRRVLWLPSRNGKSLLLSLERPDALLAALRGASGKA